LATRWGRPADADASVPADIHTALRKSVYNQGW
jgi:hypothetical protein